MKIRLSRQHQANHKEFDLKSICPSLHDDPAFSADPHSNPYSHDSLFPPPLGHPVLKNRKRPPHDTTGSDSDFHLVQPPNTPVIPSGSNSSSQYSFSPENCNKLSVPSSSMSQGDRHSSLPPAPKKENKRGFISRRSSAQVEPIKSFFSSIGKKERRRPTISGDTTSPPRPVQHTEVSEASQVPRHRGRMQDLDQIDELDETNPWGIPIHHDGPYEAANAQVNKRAGNRVPLGLANNGLYNAHLQANGQTYIPPQVPAGVSLNLSPGQILPRQFLVPFIQPASMPSTSSRSGPYTPHIPAASFLTPPHEPQYMATFLDVDSGSKVHDHLSPIQQTMQHGDDLSFNIGMAMLEPEDNALVPSPRVYLSQAVLPDEQDFDPYDPNNLESEHRRVPSPVVSARPEPSGSQISHRQSQNASTSSNKLVVVGHARNDSDPPMYHESIDEDAGHQLLNETLSKEQLQSSSQSPQSRQDCLTSENLATVVGRGLQQHSNPSDNESPLNSSRNMTFSPSDRNIPHPPAVTQDQRAEVAQGMHISPAQTSPPFLHHRRDGQSSPSVNRGNESDVQSSHHSTSTHSSSQYQNGSKPPSHRYLPKHLVMPTPLNTGRPLNTPASLHIGRIPQSQISSHVNARQTHFQPQPFNQHSLARSPLGNLPMTPAHHHGNTQAEDIPVFGGRKLRKRMSMISTPSQAPVITTVSFAPPIIGFHHNASDEKAMARSKTEKVPKRFLSKRKT